MKFELGLELGDIFEVFCEARHGGIVVDLIFGELGMHVLGEVVSFCQFVDLLNELFELVIDLFLQRVGAQWQGSYQHAHQSSALPQLTFSVDCCQHVLQYVHQR